MGRKKNIPTIQPPAFAQVEVIFRRKLRAPRLSLHPFQKGTVQSFDKDIAEKLIKQGHALLLNADPEAQIKIYEKLK